MKLNWIRLIVPALAALVLLAGSAQIAAASVIGASSATTVALTHPGEDGHSERDDIDDIDDDHEDADDDHEDADDGHEDADDDLEDVDDGDLDDDAEMEIESEIDAAASSAAYARLRALVNDEGLPAHARATIARLLEQGVQRTKSDAHACRRVAQADTATDGDLAARCRAWIDAHVDGKLTLVVCRRVAAIDAPTDALSSLIARCRDVLAERERDAGLHGRVCTRLAASDRVSDRDDDLAERCRLAADARADARADVRDDATRAQLCDRIARVAPDRLTLIERCTALLERGLGPGEIKRALRAELQAAGGVELDAKKHRRTSERSGTVRAHGRAELRSRTVPPVADALLPPWLQLSATAAASR